MADSSPPPSLGARVSPLRKPSPDIGRKFYSTLCAGGGGGGRMVGRGGGGMYGVLVLHGVLLGRGTQSHDTSAECVCVSVCGKGGEQLSSFFRFFIWEYFYLGIRDCADLFIESSNQ